MEDQKSPLTERDQTRGDGLAAMAMMLLTAALIAFILYQVI